MGGKISFIRISQQSTNNFCRIWKEKRGLFLFWWKKVPFRFTNSESIPSSTPLILENYLLRERIRNTQWPSNPANYRASASTDVGRTLKSFVSFQFSRVFSRSTIFNHFFIDCFILFRNSKNGRQRYGPFVFYFI